MMIRLAALLFIVSGATILSAQTIADDDGGLRAGPVFDALVRMDSIVFEASFVSCDAGTANAIFTDDVEFFHDQNGFARGDEVRENTKRLTAACPRERGITRTVVTDSLRVYPIQGYGAVQIGVHRFDERGAASSTLARFVHLWRNDNGNWRLARVVQSGSPASSTAVSAPSPNLPVPRIPIPCR